ncbi:MAG: hypothetical protein JRE57_17460, partial [Deltaproteobacteria bacterium]|nr:hypothetical protein [Deltaproteobacteria bacterium]
MLLRSWERWVRFVPALLLVGVAAHQVFLANTAGLSPWSGGGFGMFSTTDAGSSRHLHAFVIRPGIQREARIPEAMKDRAQRVATFPSDANLRAFALVLADLPTPDHGPATSVRIQVWHTVFDPINLAPIGRILRSLEVSVQERGPNGPRDAASESKGFASQERGPNGPRDAASESKG